jgi:low affinity Fe/Cu permease
MNDVFRRFAERIEQVVGSPWAFIAALAVLVAWGASGPFFGFTENWQLLINSFTTIVTFLVVFLIQNTQSRDFKALQIKLDELLRATAGTHRGLINLQELSDEEMDRLEQAFNRLREHTKNTTQKTIDDVIQSLDERPVGDNG